MAFRYLIYRTDFGNTIVRSDPTDTSTGGTEASLFTDFVIPEIQPLYLWRVTGGTTVVPNLDSNIEDWLNATNPPSPDDPITYSIYTGYTASTALDIQFISGATSDNTADIAYISGVTDNNFTIFQSFTAQTQTDLDGKIDIVTGQTGFIPEFDASGNLVSSTYTANDFLNGATGGTSIDLFTGYTATTEVRLEGIEGDIVYLSGETSGNTVAIVDLTADVAYISGVTDTKLDSAIFNTYTGDTRTELDLTITGATNGLNKVSRDVLLGGTLTQPTTITGDITNKLILAGYPVEYATDLSGSFNDRSLVDKAYVDMLVNGLDWKDASYVATASGDTDLDLTGGTFGGTIDGITLSDGDRVLIKNQDTNLEQNGIYDYIASSSTFTRSEDFDGTPAGEVTQGAATYIITGNTNVNTLWVLNTPDPITVGTTPLNFILFSSGGVTYVSGVGIDITGNVISLDGAAVAGDFLQWTGTQFNVTGVTSQVDFNSYTAQTTADLTFISGVTDSNTTRIENLESSVSGLTGQTFVTEDTFTGYTATTDVRLGDIETDILTISGDVIQNTTDIGLVSGETANKIDKVTGATGNLGQFTVDGNLEDTGIAISGLTGATGTVEKIQLVSSGTTSINTILPSSIDWDIVDFSGTPFLWSGGSSIWIQEDGEYEISYHLTYTQIGGGQDRSIGAYIILNNSETLDRTSSAGSTSGNDHNDSLTCPSTIFSLTNGDKLDLACFRIGGTGTVLSNAFEQVILIKKIG